MENSRLRFKNSRKKIASTLTTKHGLKFNFWAITTEKNELKTINVIFNLNILNWNPFDKPYDSGGLFANQSFIDYE